MRFAGALALLLTAALLAPDPGGAESRRDVRNVAVYLAGTLQEEALSIGSSQKALVAVKPDGCENGCQVQAILRGATGTAEAGPGKRLRLRVKLTKATRKKLRRTGRAAGQLQLSVTDSETGRVYALERRIRFRT